LLARRGHKGDVRVTSPRDVRLTPCVQGGGRLPDFKWDQLALFVAAAIVLLVFVWTHVR